MCSALQLFHPGGKTQAFFVLYFCLSYCKTQTSSVFLCVQTHKAAVLIQVTLEGELHINIFRNSQTIVKKSKEKTTRLGLWFSFCLKLCKGTGLTAGASCLTDVWEMYGEELCNRNQLSDSPSTLAIQSFWELLVMAGVWSFLFYFEVSLLTCLVTLHISCLFFLISFVSPPFLVYAPSLPVHHVLFSDGCGFFCDHSGNHRVHVV